MSYHSRPRYTQDIGFWIESDHENAEKVLKVLAEFGFGEMDINIEDLTSVDKIIQLGNAPLRIDLMTSIDGLEFEPAWSNRVEADYFGTQVHILSLQDLKTNKTASGRSRDLQDLEWIRQYSSG